MLLKEQCEREVRGSDFFGESSTLLQELKISTFFPPHFTGTEEGNMLEV